MEGEAAGPYWGEMTATIDWCEANYTVSPYIAELWNTVSNLLIILPGVLGFVTALRCQFPLRYLVCYLSLAFVGVGSWLFHMTLTWSMQLLDELPMIYCASVFLFALMDQSWSTGRSGVLISIGLLLYAACVTFLYVHPESSLAKMAVFHEIANAGQVLSIIALSYRSAKSDRDFWIIKLSIACWGFAFFFWILDQVVCGTLTSAREALPYSGGPLLQWHAWWHLGGGVGSYLFIVFISSSQLQRQGHDVKLERFILPYVTIKAPKAQ